jgi:putative oxidoreductase
MFLYAGAVKLARYDHSGLIVARYKILPEPIASALGLVLPWVEVFAGVVLLFGRFGPAGPALSTLLGLAFAYASSAVLRRGDDAPCGCSGGTEDRVTWATLARALLIACCGLMLLAIDWNTVHRAPVAVAVAVTLAALLPGGVILERRLRHARLHREQMLYAQEEVARLTRLNGSPPERSLSAGEASHEDSQQTRIAEAL